MPQIKDYQVKHQRVKPQAKKIFLKMKILVVHNFARDDNIYNVVGCGSVW